eukprot:350628-Chlamydomonas_euryale.AAC.7
MVQSNPVPCIRCMRGWALTKLPMLTRYTACWPYHRSSMPMCAASRAIPAATVQHRGGGVGLGGYARRQTRPVAAARSAADGQDRQSRLPAGGEDPHAHPSFVRPADVPPLHIPRCNCRLTWNFLEQRLREVPHEPRDEHGNEEERRPGDARRVREHLPRHARARLTCHKAGRRGDAAAHPAGHGNEHCGGGAPGAVPAAAVMTLMGCFVGWCGCCFPTASHTQRARRRSVCQVRRTPGFLLSNQLYAAA